MSHLPSTTDDAEYPSPTIVDSRRLLGPNLFSAREGAVLDVAIADPLDTARLVAAWQSSARALLALLGWGDFEEVAARTFPGGASCFISGRIDRLLATTEVCEQAWVRAEGRAGLDDGALLAHVRAVESAERNDTLVALQDAAFLRGTTFTFDDDAVSLGSGNGAVTFLAASLALARSVSWSDVHDVPIALVTGSNGKTTTTRLVAAMVERVGRRVGLCTTDGVLIGSESVAEGDYAGPAGARIVLRDQRVGTAILETARGGLLRRGLAVHRADVAIVTNISADHFGEHGILDLDGLAQVKLIVARAIDSRGHLVLNADDPVLVRAASKVTRTIIWFSLDAENPVVRAHCAVGGEAVVVRSDTVTWRHGEDDETVMRVPDIVLTAAGAARHNVSNVLGAVAVAHCLGIPIAAIRETLREFGSQRTDNPGRFAVREIGGVTIVVDYAHNPDGVSALAAAAAKLPARRRLIVLGQAGNREDDALRALAGAAWTSARFDRVVLKEMERFRRRRPVGETSAIMAAELARLGAPSETIVFAPTELDAVRDALSWSQAGDLLLLTIHAERDAVLTLLEHLETTGWEAGEALP